MPLQLFDALDRDRDDILSCEDLAKWVLQLPPPCADLIDVDPEELIMIEVVPIDRMFFWDIVWLPRWSSVVLAWDIACLIESPSSASLGHVVPCMHHDIEGDTSSSASSKMVSQYSSNAGWYSGAS